MQDEEYTKTALVNAESVLTGLKAKIPQVSLDMIINLNHFCEMKETSWKRLI